MKGYEALRETAAWIDVSGRGKIRVTGEDRARLLHAMTTNDVKSLTAGQGCYAFFLSAQGRVLADVHVFCLADELLLDTEPETASKVYQHLDQFIIADDATLADETSVTTTLALEGPAATQVLERAGAPVPAAPESHAEWGNWRVARVSLAGGTGFLIFAPAADQPALVETLERAGAVEADAEALNVVRLEHGKPRYGDDITERYLTQETNQMHAVSFAKGCYLGQEIVERVRSRAQIHRRLMPLSIEGSSPPAPGTKFKAADKDVAEVMSAAYSPGLGHSMALAYVRIDSNPGAVLNAGDLTATVLPAPSQPSLESESCR